VSVVRPTCDDGTPVGDAVVVGRLVSVNVGRARDVQWEGRTVRTAVWKNPVRGSVMVRRGNIDGDEQADKIGHGGEHRAVFVYQLDSYRYWAEHLGRDDFENGQFGENFTVEGLADDEVCIGDRYRVGEAIFEVTQPRVTCFRVGIRMNEPDMPSLLVAHRRPGFYLRVLTEGTVQSGQAIERVAVGPEQVSVADCDALLYLPHKSAQTLQRVLRIPALSAGWQGSFEAMAATPVVPPAAAWDGFAPLRVASVQEESDTITSFVLRPLSEQAPTPRSKAGQYLTLRLQPEGASGPPVVRSYSMSSVAGEDGYRISVRRVRDGAGSSYLHQHIHEGDVVAVAAPRGDFVLRDGQRPVVLLSAGVGATPMLAMLHALVKRRDQREVWWVHGARDRSEHAFGSEVDELLRTLRHSHRLVSYSNHEADGINSPDFDIVGRIFGTNLRQAGVPADADYYLCGPDAFMKALSSAIAAQGTPPQQIAMEIFGAHPTGLPPGMTRGPAPHQPNPDHGTGPTVSFTRSNLTVQWDPAHGNLLQLAEACDVPAGFGCRNGVCHACESEILSGTVDYVTLPLQAPDDHQVLLCCAAPTSDLALEL
jgi:ferredoxin-NADP reductase/MOSC domain-containing protein YiiM